MVGGRIVVSLVLKRLSIRLKTMFRKGNSSTGQLEREALDVELDQLST